MASKKRQKSRTRRASATTQQLKILREIRADFAAMAKQRLVSSISPSSSPPPRATHGRLQEHLNALGFGGDESGYADLSRRIHDLELRMDRFEFLAPSSFSPKPVHRRSRTPSSSSGE